MLSTDPQLQRLRPYAQSPVTWFRNPYATLIVVSALQCCASVPLPAPVRSTRAAEGLRHCICKWQLPREPRTWRIVGAASASSPDFGRR